MPEMGESVTEGTVLEWHKREGEPVSAAETIVEVSTDKVDAEVPAPAAGILTKIYAPEGETIERWIAPRRDQHERREHAHRRRCAPRRSCARRRSCADGRPTERRGVG